jgi:hypothetical protein
MYDVRPEQYATIIREMLRHENDLTNHRIMWLLIGQGFIANAFISAGRERAAMGGPLAALGLFLSLSAFVMLYRSYQARGYLSFLGQRAKQGRLREEDLPIIGWPPHRIRGWSREVWAHPWIAKTSDVLEPWLFLPYCFLLLWLAGLLRTFTELRLGVVLILASLLSVIVFMVSCGAMVRTWDKHELDS